MSVIRRKEENTKVATKLPNYLNAEVLTLLSLNVKIPKRRV